MKPARNDDPTVGVLFDGPIADQREVRPDRAVKSLAEFLEFIDAFEALFGPTIRSSRPIEGNRFLL